MSHQTEVLGRLSLHSMYTLGRAHLEWSKSLKRRNKKRVDATFLYFTFFHLIEFKRNNCQVNASLETNEFLFQTYVVKKTNVLLKSFKKKKMHPTIAKRCYSACFIWSNFSILNDALNHPCLQINRTYAYVIHINCTCHRINK